MLPFWRQKTVSVIVWCSLDIGSNVPQWLHLLHCDYGQCLHTTPPADCAVVAHTSHSRVLVDTTVATGNPITHISYCDYSDTHRNEDSVFVSHTLIDSTVPVTTLPSLTSASDFCISPPLQLLSCSIYILSLIMPIYHFNPINRSLTHPVCLNYNYLTTVPLTAVQMMAAMNLILEFSIVLNCCLIFYT